MIQGSVKIINKLGLHARASAKFVQMAKGYPCAVRLGRPEDEMINGKSMMHIMTLSASQGTDLQLETDGEEEELAFEQLSQLITDCFGEGE